MPVIRVNMDSGSLKGVRYKIIKQTVTGSCWDLSWLSKCSFCINVLETRKGLLLLHHKLRHSLEKWFNGKEHLLLLQRTWGGFETPLHYNSYNSSSRGPETFVWPLLALLHRHIIKDPKTRAFPAHMHSRKGLHRQDSLVIHQHRLQCGFDILTVDLPRWLWEERRVFLSWNPPTFMSFPCFPLIILPWLSFPEYATHPPLLPSWQSTPVSGVCIFQNKLLFIHSISLHWIFSFKMKENKKRERTL